MSNAAAWAGYVIAAAVALILVYRAEWRITLATFAGGAVGLLVWLPFALVSKRPEDAHPWVEVDIALNGSMSLIFAALGAAIGYAIRSYLRHRDDE